MVWLAHNILLVGVWEQAKGGKITLEHYKAAGGWENGLEDDLNGLYDKLAEPQRGLVGACSSSFQSWTRAGRCAVGCL
jgi:hypothetical protein